MEGWNKKIVGNVCNVLKELYNVQYEIEHCVKGSYTQCKTYNELSDYIINLAEELLSEADSIKNN